MADACIGEGKRCEQAKGKAEQSIARAEASDENKYVGGSEQRRAADERRGCIGGNKSLQLIALML